MNKEGERERGRKRNREGDRTQSIARIAGQENEEQERGACELEGGSSG